MSGMSFLALHRKCFCQESALARAWLGGGQRILDCIYTLQPQLIYIPFNFNSSPKKVRSGRVNLNQIDSINRMVFEADIIVHSKWR